MGRTRSRVMWGPDRLYLQKVGEVCTQLDAEVMAGAGGGAERFKVLRCPTHRRWVMHWTGHTRVIKRGHRSFLMELADGDRQ